MRLRSTVILIALIVLFVARTGYSLDPVCTKWFNKLGIKTGDSSCEIKCASSNVDLSVVHCPEQCDELCRQRPKCISAHEYWEPKLKLGKPQGWPEKEAKPRDWTPADKTMLIRVLNKISRQLWVANIESIYRLTGTHDTENFASSASSMVVLYDPSFKDERTLTHGLIHEFAHHYYWSLGEDTTTRYNYAAGWTPVDKKQKKWSTRKTSFVKSDGITSPEEDFANNLEYFVLNPQKLKTVNPTAYAWFTYRFGDSLKNGGACDVQK